jgi:hypothetical protein
VQPSPFQSIPPYLQILPHAASVTLGDAHSGSPTHGAAVDSRATTEPVDRAGVLQAWRVDAKAEGALVEQVSSPRGILHTGSLSGSLKYCRCTTRVCCHGRTGGPHWHSVVTFVPHLPVVVPLCRCALKETVWQTPRRSPWPSWTFLSRT